MNHKQTSPAATGLTSMTLDSARRTNYSATRTPMSTGRRVYSSGRLCGFIDGDTFRRTFDSARHVLRRLNAIALADDVLQQIADVEHLRLIDETGREHWLTLAEVHRYGIAVNDPRFGPQLAVPLRYWRQTRDIATPIETEGPPEWRQGSLL